MEIKSNLLDDNGIVKLEFTYNDGNPQENLNGIRVGGVGGFCFCDNKIVLVYGKNKWGPPGGAIEEGETYKGAMKREIKEEANMEILHQEIIGYQDIYNKIKDVKWRHVIMFCIVKPFGDFIADPDGDITEIKLVDPSEFSLYVKDWREAGKYILNKAIDLKNKFDLEK